MDTLNQFLASLLSPEVGSLNFAQSITAIFVAYLGGLLSSLTPCVYPMIPITIGVIGGMTQSSESPRQRLWHELLLRGFVYVLGMAVVYSFLGVLAGLTGKVFGTLTNTPAWYLGLGIILSASALVMMDVIPFDPMAWYDQMKRRFYHLRGKPHPVHSSAQHREMTLLGAFTLGASSGFIAAPCTTPILTSILAYIAKTQSVGLGLLLMLSFSFGLGTLLLGIAAFTGSLQILPRSGNWLKTMKTLSGLLLLAFAEYLFYRAGGLGGLK